MFKQLIKESFELWCKKRWLKQIKRETNKRDKHYLKYCQHKYVAEQLYKNYQNQYMTKEMVGKA